MTIYSKWYTVQVSNRIAVAHLPLDWPTLLSYSHVLCQSCWQCDMPRIWKIERRIGSALKNKTCKNMKGIRCDQVEVRGTAQIIPWEGSQECGGWVVQFFLFLPLAQGSRFVERVGHSFSMKQFCKEGTLVRLTRISPVYLHVLNPCLYICQLQAWHSMSILECACWTSDIRNARLEEIFFQITQKRSGEEWVSWHTVAEMR